jgi:hypothetical protein
MLRPEWFTALKGVDDRRDFIRAWNNVRKNVKISAEDSVDYIPRA